MPTDPQLEAHPYAPEVLLGESPAIRRLRLQIDRIAPHFRIALLTGESGSGKHTIARVLHRLSPVAADPFVALSAEAFAQTRAFPGTFYLTAVDSLDSAAQLAFLRALRLRRDSRIIVATRTDLKGMVSAGRMRSDLYDAIANLEIRLAPLRSRFDDLDLIARTMLRRIEPKAVLHPSALARLREHTWPENLAELQSLIQQLAPVGLIEPRHLPSLQSAQPRTAARLEDVMHRHVMDVLQSCSGNKLRAAELLGISRSTLYRMLESRETPAV